MSHIRSNSRKSGLKKSPNLQDKINNAIIYEKKGVKIYRIEIKHLGSND